MSWVQVLPFNLSKMGTKKGYCLQNDRLAFGITKGTFASAKADMESQKKNGTLHYDNPPANVAVPVYVDSTSVYEHVMVCDHGTYYSDGKKVSKPTKTFGWGELCDGVRVVKWVEDAKKSNEEIAREVIAGKWGNGDERKNRLKQAGYDYNAIQSLVNTMLKPTSRKSNEEIAREVIAGKWGNGYERKTRIKKAGYDYNAIQAIVNRLMK